MDFRTILISIALVLVAALSSPAHAGRLEAGSFISNDTLAVGTRFPTPVTFQQTFDVPPIVVAISDQRGGNAASIRITDITTNGFNALILEPDNFDGRHLDQVVQYIAIEPGRHILPGGLAIEAGRTNTNAVQFGPGVSGVASFTNVSFSSPLASNATVLTQLQTANSETRDVPSQSSRPHITSLSVNATNSGFNLALERSQSAIGTVQTETVGWIAFPSSTSESFPDINGTTINWGASNSGNIVRGWDDGCFNVNLPIVSANIVAVAKKRTRFNGDGGWTRYCTLSSSLISLRIDEDTDLDNERSIAAADAESVAIIAFSQPFHADLRANIEVTKVSATISGTSLNDYTLPGAIREYIITVRNVGNAPPNYATLILSDALPAQIDLLVTDIAGGGSGPVAFTGVNGTALLAYSFNGLTDTNDSLTFFDSGNIAIIPSADANGADANVSTFQINPAGTLEGDRGAGPGEFNLRYRARIQ